MTVLNSLTQLGGVAGVDTFEDLRLERVIADGNYVWVPDIQSSGASQSVTADPAPAAEGHYLVEYAAAGAFTLPAIASLNDGEAITVTNVNGTPITITPAAGEVLNLEADRTWLSDSTGQEVTIRKTAGGWRVGPNVVTAETTARVGEIVHATPDSAKGKYLLDGSAYSDAALAAHLTANPITGFSVAGVTVTTPDWRGRYLGGSGGLGIGTAGQELASTNKSHSHTVGNNGSHAHQQPLGGAQGGANAYGAGNINVTSTNSTNTAGDHSHGLSSEGSTYGRPETASMPLCIIGTEQAAYQAGTLLPEPIAPVIVAQDGTGNPSGSTFTPTQTGLYELKANGTIYHNIAAGAASATLQVREGTTVIAERFGTQGANQDNGVRQPVIYSINDIPLTAGVAYNINLNLGGSSFTDASDFWYIALKQQPTSTAVRAEDAVIVLYAGTTGGGTNHTETIPTTVNGKTLVNADASQEYGSGAYTRSQQDGTNLYTNVNYTTGAVSFVNRSGVFAAARGYRIVATYM